MIFRCVPRNRCSPPRRRQEDIEGGTSVRSTPGKFSSSRNSFNRRKWKTFFNTFHDVKNLFFCVFLGDDEIFPEDYQCDTEFVRSSKIDIDSYSENTGTRSGITHNYFINEKLLKFILLAPRRKLLICLTLFRLRPTGLLRIHIWRL